MAKAPILQNPVPDPEKINPKDNAELIQRGWLFFGQKNYSKALNDFSAALNHEPDNPDLLFALGLTYKSMGAVQNAVETFEKVLLHLDQYADAVEARMLLRMVHGHINQLKNGDWNLEKEIWHYVR